MKELLKLRNNVSTYVQQLEKYEAAAGIHYNPGRLLSEFRKINFFLQNMNEPLPLQISYNRSTGTLFGFQSFEGLRKEVNLLLEAHRRLNGYVESHENEQSTQELRNLISRCKRLLNELASI